MMLNPIMPMPGTMGGARIIFKIPMIKKTKIGFVGHGFVGSAISNVYTSEFLSDVIIVDPGKGFTGTYNDLADADGVFVCVPSPQGDDGVCDTSILEDVLTNLKKVNFRGVIISKVTAPPQVYRRLQAEYFNLVHAPEFLTAANAKFDYLRSSFAIIGGELSVYKNEAERIIKMGLPQLSNIVHCSIEEASLAKYTINTFLATKVIFMNEIAKLADNLGCDYKAVSSMVNLDTRIGTSHMQVPGPDGAYGFGGMCFPKDTAALLTIAKEAGTDMQVLDAAVKKNTLLRLT